MIKQRKYKCPECGQRTMLKNVFTEEHCQNPKCNHVEHTVHAIKRKRI